MRYAQPRFSGQISGRSGFARSFLLLLCVLSLLLGSILPAQASDHGGGGGPSPMKFTTNLGSASGGRYLQIELVLEAASPEVGAEVEAFKPRIQHEIILLLADETDTVLRTLEGKQALAEKILNAVNHVIHSDDKNGVKEVYFTNFIIQ